MAAINFNSFFTVATKWANECMNKVFEAACNKCSRVGAQKKGYISMQHFSVVGWAFTCECGALALNKKLLLILFAAVAVCCAALTVGTIFLLLIHF